jgi:hypothetical protein
LFIGAGFPFRSVGGEFYVEEKEGESDEIFEKRRMLWVETHISISDRTIVSRDMRSFVIDCRLLARVCSKPCF